jgi:MFS family permease
MPFIVGLLALGVSTALICIGNSIAILVGGRVLQGGSAAVVGAVGLALINDTFDKEEIGQAMGYIGISTSLGILLAPLLGGLVYAHAGYFSVFAMAFGLIAVDVVLRLAIIEKSVAARLEGRTIGSDSIAHTDVPLENLGDAITPAAPLEPVQPVPIARDSNVPAPNKHSTLRILLTSRRFLAGVWGTTVQATLLTAFDSVSSLPIPLETD